MPGKVKVDKAEYELKADLLRIHSYESLLAGHNIVGGVNYPILYNVGCQSDDWFELQLVPDPDHKQQCTYAWIPQDRKAELWAEVENMRKGLR